MYNIIDQPEKCCNTDAHGNAVDEHDPYKKLEESNNTQPQHNGKANGRYCSQNKKFTRPQVIILIARTVYVKQLISCHQNVHSQ